MSKRFGRNQKRRMREQIAQMTAERDINKDFYLQERARGERNRRIVEETAQVLGRHFCTLDPDCVEVRDLNQLVHGWRVMDEPPLECYLWDTELPTFATFTERVLPILYGSVQTDQLRRHVHMEFTYHGKMVGYGIDLDTLKLMPPKVAVERMGREMARHLQRSLELI